MFGDRSISIDNYLTFRAEKFLEKHQALLSIFARSLDKFYIAGGYFKQNWSDIDIFVESDTVLGQLPDYYKVISVTRNALTFRTYDDIIQICKYHYPTLKELVDSFDYAHIKVGVEFKCLENGRWVIDSIYYTREYVEANVVRNSIYTGGKYPLASLIRALKYYKKEEITKGSAIASIIAALVDVIERGFLDYEDFKDQLDAVDLGMVPEHLDELEQETLTSLFRQLSKV